MVPRSSWRWWEVCCQPQARPKPERTPFNNNGTQRVLATPPWQMIGVPYSGRAVQSQKQIHRRKVTVWVPAFGLIASWHFGCWTISQLEPSQIVREPQVLSNMLTREHYPQRRCGAFLINVENDLLHRGGLAQRYLWQWQVFVFCFLLWCCA